MMMINMVDWMIKDNYFHHVCYWIDANLEWLWIMMILPDSTAGLLRFKCVLTLIVVLMMVSALKPD